MALHTGFPQVFLAVSADMRFLDAADLRERHRLIETFELCLHAIAYVHQRLYPCVRTGANEDLATNGVGFDTIGSVDRSYSTVFGTFDRTDVADNDFAGVNANAHGEFRQLSWRCSAH